MNFIDTTLNNYRDNLKQSINTIKTFKKKSQVKHGIVDNHKI